MQCDGNPNLTQPVQVVFTKDESKLTATPNDESIRVGDWVRMVKNDGKKLPSDLKIEIRSNGSMLQSLKIHTSCSKPLNVDDQFGSLVLREFIPE